MGNCFKSCLPESRAAKTFRNLNILDDTNPGVDFTFLVDDASSIAEKNKRSSCTSKDIQLECLDARALLENTVASTPSASSLDLEWEHETIDAPPMIHDRSGSTWVAFAENVSFCASDSSAAPSAVSESDWSRVSSLEWDNVQNPIPPVSPPLSEVDADTQFLLCEIERLTNKTLEETGRDLFR